MAVGAYRGTEQSLDAQKRALLSAVAERGQAGQAAFEAQQKAAQAFRADAVRGVAKDMGVTAPPAALAGQLRNTAGGPGAVYAGEAATQGAAFNSGIAGISAANAAYMDQAAAARPVAETVTERTVARIRAEREAELAQQEHDRQMAEAETKQAELDAEAARQAQADAREEHQWAKESHDWDMQGAEADRQAAGKVITPKSLKDVSTATGLDPAQVGQIKALPEYKQMGSLMQNMFDSGYSKAETYAAMQAYRKQIEKASGHGWGRTFDVVWAEFQHAWGSPTDQIP